MQENEIAHQELMRQLIEMAIRSGRKKQSAQTGYIHYCHQAAEEDKHDPIPIQENILFALALLRSRISENVLEAKALIEGLLHFQVHEGASPGNFPRYVHEYPACKQRLLGANLLPPLYWILKSFHHVLGSNVKARLESALLKLAEFSVQTLQEKPAPYPLTLKIAASSQAIGHFLRHSSLEEQGSQLLSSLQAISNPEAWYCSSDLADCAIALQMLYQDLNQSPWKNLWSQLTLTWAQHACCYIGPALKESQWSNEPQPALYDLFLGYLTQRLPQRAIGDQMFHLQAALIQPTEGLLPPSEPSITHSGFLHSRPWHVHKTPTYAISCIETDEIGNPAEKGLHPFRLIWGNADRVHSFVAQGGNSRKMTFHISDTSIDLFFHLQDPLQQDDKESSREIGFYFDIHPEAHITTLGHTTTTFQLGDPVQIVFQDFTLAIEFTIEEGTGRFFGHLMPGNRPSQSLGKGTPHFQGYDWQLFLRTLERTSPCEIKARLTISENPTQSQI